MCEDDEICSQSGTTKRCEPKCEDDSCGDMFCGANGICAECLNDNDCESGRCNASLCVIQCQTDADCSSAGLKKCDNDANVCVAECTSDADCILGSFTLETNLCEEAGQKPPPKDIVDDGCGCASSHPKIPLTPFVFCLFIAIVGIRRKTKLT